MLHSFFTREKSAPQPSTHTLTLSMWIFIAFNTVLITPSFPAISRFSANEKFINNIFLSIYLQLTFIIAESMLKQRIHILALLTWIFIAFTTVLIPPIFPAVIRLSAILMYKQGIIKQFGNYYQYSLKKGLLYNNYYKH